MTNTMAAFIVEHCTYTTNSNQSRRSLTHTLGSIDPQMPHEEILQKTFDLDEFQRLMYNSNLVDESGTCGIKYGDMALIFRRAVRNMSQRLEARAAKKKAAVS